MRLRAYLLVVGMAVASLAACGDETADTGASSGSAATATDSATPTESVREPLCSAVWTVGQDVPEGYEGCSDETGWVPADEYLCDSGQLLVTYADRYYAATGAQVNDAEGSLADSTPYQKARKRC